MNRNFRLVLSTSKLLLHSTQSPILRVRVFEVCPLWWVNEKKLRPHLQEGHAALFKWSHNTRLRCDWCKIPLARDFWDDNLFFSLGRSPLNCPNGPNRRILFQNVAYWPSVYKTGACQLVRILLLSIRKNSDLLNILFCSQLVGI